MLERYESLMAAAREAGFEQAEVYFSAQNGFSVSVYDGRIEDYRVEAQSGLALRGLMNGQMGYASTEVDEESEYPDLVRRAAENARVLESKDEQFLYGGSEALDWTSAQDERLSEVSAERKIALALELEQECLRRDARVRRVASCEVGTQLSRVEMANTLGLRREFSQGLAYAAVEVVLDAGEGRQVDGYAAQCARSFEELDAQALAAEAVERAARGIGASSMPSGAMPVVLSRDAMRTLLGAFAGVFSADAAQRGLSLLADKEGSCIAAPAVTLVDDPGDGLGLAGAPFDGEGVPTRKKAVIERGTLNTLLYTLKTAKKAGKATTGNACRPSYRSTVSTAPTNFYLEPGDLAPEELYALAGDGVRVDQLMGAHAGANPISGDFSLAARGMRIEGGRVTRPVDQITISGNFYQLLKEVRAVGKDLKFGLPGASCIGAPSVLAGGLTVAGK